MSACLFVCLELRNKRLQRNHFNAFFPLVFTCQTSYVNGSRDGTVVRALASNHHHHHHHHHRRLRRRRRCRRRHHYFKKK